MSGVVVPGSAGYPPGGADGRPEGAGARRRGVGGGAAVVKLKVKPQGGGCWLGIETRGKLSKLPVIGTSSHRQHHHRAWEREAAGSGSGGGLF